MFKLSTVLKKQITGITGLVMLLWILAHLSGNFLIFKGPQAFNEYAAFLQSLGPLLWVTRIVLLVMVVVHIGFSIQLSIQNKQSRKHRYHQLKNHTNENSLSVKLMPYTGSIILIYIIFHLLDFTLAEKVGLVNGVDYGLYGLIINVLGQPLHAFAYIIAMMAAGSHLYHAFQSVFQTFGLMSHSTQSKLMITSKVLGIAVAVGFSSIPIYILIAF